MRVVMMTALALVLGATEVSAQGGWTPIWPSEKPAKKAAKSVVRQVEKPVETSAPTLYEPAKSTAGSSFAIEQMINPHVALFSNTDRLYWYGQINGSLKVHGTPKHLAKFSMTCIEKDSDKCATFKLTQIPDADMAASASYVSFNVNGRLVVWPHNYMVSNKPFGFVQKPVLERF